MNDSVLDGKRALAVEIDCNTGWKGFIGRLHRFFTEEFKPDRQKDIHAARIKWWI